VLTSIVALWIVLTPLAAFGAEHPKIMVMFEQTSPPFLPRVRAELTASGFPIVVTKPPSFPPNRQEVEVLARQEGATVALSLIEAGGGVEVWVLDPTSKTMFREVLLGLYDPHENPDVIALRLVETLRATLMEVERTHPVVLPVEPPQQEIDLSPRPPRFALAMGGGVAYSPGGFGATGHVAMSFQWWVTPRWTLSVDGLATPEPAKLRGPEGVASVAWYAAGIAGAVYLTDPAAAIRLRAGAGVWLGIMSISGVTASPYFTRRVETISAIPHLDVAPQLALSSRLSLGLAASLGVQAPSTGVQFAQRRVADWGRPVVLGAVTLGSTLD
jgi:hypothetical protein